MRLSTTVFALLSAAALALGPANASADWQQSPGPGPSARSASVMAYDSARRNVVLFGGSGEQILGDTWLRSGDVWTQAHPATSPPPRYAAQAAYDERRHELVVFGGVDTLGGMPSSDTWVWDGTTWENRSPTISPPARSNGAMAYDAATGKIVLFSGSNPDIPGVGGLRAADTWTWDGTAWTLEHPLTSPPGRIFATMSSAPGGHVVLFGGRGLTSPLGDTWTWDGTNWTQRSPAHAPPARFFAAATYDGVRALVYGGIAASGPHLNDLWAWDGSDWSSLQRSLAPAARSYPALAYDGAEAKLVLFGGVNDDGRLGDTWLDG